MKTAVISGASRGIGRAIACRLAADGYSLIIVARRGSLLKELADELTKEHKVRVVVFEGDVTKRADVERLAAMMKEDPDFSKLRVLVNNAGLALGLEKTPECDLDDWEVMVDTNIKGLLYMTRILVEFLIAYGKGATIVNLGSIAGRWPYTGGNVYGGTKAFVRQFSINLRQDLAGTGVRVTDVEPGLVETDFSLVRFKNDAANAAAVYKNRSPLVPADIAHTVAFVAALEDRVCIPFFEVVPTSQTAGPIYFTSPQ